MFPSAPASQNPIAASQVYLPRPTQAPEHFAIKDNEAYEPTYKGDRHSHTALADSHVRPSCSSQVPTALAVEVCCTFFGFDSSLRGTKTICVSGQYAGGGV